MITRFLDGSGEILYSSAAGPPVTDDGVVLDASGVRYRIVDSTTAADDTTCTVEPDLDAPTESSFETRVIPSTDGVELRLHHLGGSGDPLLICHATGFHGRAYAPMARLLAERYAVWAIDFRGHGASTPPISGDFSWERMAEDLLACIAAVGGPPVYAVGHSMGGAAILLAELASPGAVSAAYMYEPVVFPSRPAPGRGDENTLAVLARKRRPVFPSKTAVFERYSSRPPLNELRTDALAAYVAHAFTSTEDGDVELTCAPEHEGRTFDAALTMTVERVLGVQLRLAVARGVIDDTPGPAAYAAHVVDAIAGATLCLHDELGHFGPLEQPDVVAREVLEQFRRMDSIAPDSP